VVKQAIAAAMAASLSISAPWAPAVRAQAPGGLELDHAALDAIVEAKFAESGAPGCSVGVIVGDALVYEKALGLKSKVSDQPAAVDTLYQIGSVTKVFTATLLAVLRDENQLQFDDEMTRFLPPGTELRSVFAGAPAITLRHLVTHTAGLPRDPVGVDRKQPVSAEALVGSLAVTDAVLPAGQQVMYSNLGFMLLGRCLERASGQDYETLLRSRILEPLGMNSTRLALTRESVEGIAGHYWPEDNGASERPAWVFGEACGAGGIISNVPDLARFISAQMRWWDAAAAPVRGATLVELHTPQRMMDGSWSRAIGLGWCVTRNETHGEIVYHGGETDGHASAIGFSVRHGVGVVVLTNRGGDTAEPMARALLAEVMKAAEAQRQEAMRLVNAGDWPAALDAANAVLARSPGDARAHYSAGFTLLRLGQNEEAAAAFVRAAELGFSVGTNRYNAACALALAGDTDGAFDQLFRARRAGFSDREQVKADPDLESLRSDARWGELMAGK